MAKIQVGDPAPAFEATTYDGKPIRLADFLHRRAVVLFFYPKDGTAVCTQEACAFRDSYEQFLTANTEVIGVSSDSDDRHQAFAQQHRLPFPLISDRDGALRTLYGVPRTWGLIPGRVTYVIDKEGIIRSIFNAQFASDEHVQRAMAAIREVG